MENPSAFDINIRSVDVRLNDSHLESNMNGDIDNTLYISRIEDNKTQTKSSHDRNDDKSTESSSKDIHRIVFSNAVHDEIKRVDEIKVNLNGLTKVRDVEILNTHLEKINHRTCDQALNHEDSSRTNCELTSSENISLSPELTLTEVNNCDKQNANRDASAIEIMSPPNFSPNNEILSDVNITYLGYESEKQMPDIMRLIQKDLSEPYSIYTYRYFIHNWPKLCFLAQYGDHCVGAIVCKLDVHKKQSRRGYIAMLAVDEKYRKKKIGSNLVLKAIHAMVEDNADEVVLETEITNKPALKLYENLGFVRDKRLFRYYLNGVDALRLKLWLR